jgi:hypothetical protein
MALVIPHMTGFSPQTLSTASSATPRREYGAWWSYLLLLRSPDFTHRRDDTMKSPCSTTHAVGMVAALLVMLCAGAAYPYAFSAHMDHYNDVLEVYPPGTPIGNLISDPECKPYFLYGSIFPDVQFSARLKPMLQELYQMIEDRSECEGMEYEINLDGVPLYEWPFGTSMHHPRYALEFAHFLIEQASLPDPPGPDPGGPLGPNNIASKRKLAFALGVYAHLCEDIVCHDMLVPELIAQDEMAALSLTKNNSVWIPGHSESAIELMLDHRLGYTKAQLVRQTIRYDVWVSTYQKDPVVGPFLIFPGTDPEIYVGLNPTFIFFHECLEQWYDVNPDAFIGYPISQQGLEGILHIARLQNSLYPEIVGYGSFVESLSEWIADNIDWEWWVDLGSGILQVVTLGVYDLIDEYAVEKAIGIAEEHIAGEAIFAVDVLLGLMVSDPAHANQIMNENAGFVNFDEYNDYLDGPVYLSTNFVLTPFTGYYRDLGAAVFRDAEPGSNWVEDWTTWDQLAMRTAIQTSLNRQMLGSYTAMPYVMVKDACFRLNGSRYFGNLLTYEYLDPSDEFSAHVELYNVRDTSPLTVSLKVVTAERIAVASTSALLDHDPYDYNTTDPVSMSVAFPLGDLLSYWDVNDGLKLYIELYLGSSSVPFFSSKWDDYAALEKVDPVDKPVYDEFDSFGEWPNSLRISGAHFAATIWVSPDGSDTHSGSEYWPYATFQKAIDEASFEWNDVIMAKPGVYTGEGNRNVVCGGKKITIISEEGPENTIIDLDGTGSMRQFIRFEDGETPATRLEGFTIRNGYANYYPVNSGAGVYCSASPTIRDCVFENCWAGAGGGIEVFHDSVICAPQIIDCTFIDCGSLSTSGGGICCAKRSQAYISGCEFYNCFAYTGGGVLVSASGSATIRNSLFSGCGDDPRNGAGGGVFVGGPTTITNCTFVNNVCYYGSAVSVGGAAADLVFERNIVARNDMYGVHCYGTGETSSWSHNNFWDNELGAFTESGACDETTIGGDQMFEDPVFCYWESNTDVLYTLRNDSPCLPDNNDWGVLIGALGVGCSRPVPPPPSCPVLFVERDGEFEAENTLLTACEESGYRDEVVDYYRLPDDVRPVDGTFAFELREMEDEISYVRDLELVAVRHGAGTRAQCSVDGAIVVHGKSVVPVSAFDQNGVDRLAEIAAEDGELFSAKESGHLIIEFPYPDDGVCTITTARVPKSIKDKIQCPATPVFDRVLASDDGKHPIRLGLEVLEPDGSWSEQTSAPIREWPHDEVFSRTLPASSDGTYTVRLSWDGPYETDAVVAAGSPVEPLGIEAHRVSRHALERASDLSPAWFGFDGSDALVLRNGDVLEFAFEVEEDVSAGEVTTYVVRAQGRYEPDYDVYTDLKPQAFALLGNYPNPFNPSTTVRYDLPTGAPVKIAVYDAAGRKVATLVDELQTAGRKSVEWCGLDDGGNSVASGVYFCRMNAGGHEKNVKMMLMK